jgi:predicted nuclease with RNAse H fold
MLVVGIDMATVATKVGLALASYDQRDLILREAVLGTPDRSPANIVRTWLRDTHAPTLLAIDAPLGWPQSLASSLAAHRAGEAIPTPPNELFRRLTDHFIHRELGKTPLDVGADRIARTAHAALALLRELRQGLEAQIPLAWSPTITGIQAIEVYPAATLVAHGIPSTGYKAIGQGAKRREILAALGRRIRIGRHAGLLEQHPDALDAVVCLVAAQDFLVGHAMRPIDLPVAAREGWIWAAAKS